LTSPAAASDAPNPRLNPSGVVSSIRAVDDRAFHLVKLGIDEPR
jgi:hypothetical protein